MFRLLVPALLLTVWIEPLETYAQQPPPCAVAGEAVDTAPRKPDITIRASVRAEEVRFAKRPEAEVRLTGCSVLDRVRVIERRNLPEPVQPGVTYRNVFVAVEILGHLDVACLLPGMGLSPRGTAPGTRSDRDRPGSNRLCPSGARDTVPRPLPRP